MNSTEGFLRILVVDDEESLRDIVSMVLLDDGHTVSTASNGDKALEKIYGKPFDLVLTDIRMPGIDGIELLGKIKAYNPKIEVIMMTSHASLDTSVSSLRSGAFDYLMKPFDDLSDISEIVDRVREKIATKNEKDQLVTELKSQNETLLDMAEKDGLTGLYNHRYFKEYLSKEIDRAKRYNSHLSVILLDVDHFKVYNDTNGHPEGDKLLKQLAEIFSLRTRSHDVVARYGGEEFVFILPETQHESALLLAESICQRVAKSHFAGRKSQPNGKLTVSLGVASYPDHAEDMEGLVKLADEALYLAKHNGRDRVCSIRELNSASKESLE
jgi:diguanylate cyclase (GGDEF)-like protein